jgi:uncharacterized protein with HEPN domain
MRRELLLIQEMIDAAMRVRSLIGDRDAANLFADRDKREALLWNYRVLGEASGQVPAETRDRYPAVEWVMATRLRNRIVHGYWEIDFETLHAAATDDLPAMISALTGALTELATAEGVRTSEGVLLTNDAVERLTAEAEAGYDVEQLKQSAQSQQEVEEQP